MRTFPIRFVLMLMLTVFPALMAVFSAGQVRAQADTSSPSGISLPILGTLQGEGGVQGTFQGTVSELLASAEAEPVLSGVLNGLALIGDDTVRVENQPFSSPVTPSVVDDVPAEDYLAMHVGNAAAGTPDTAGTPSAMVPSRSLDATTFQFFQTQSDPGKCDVLYLDLQPITLNLLGLELLTSRITLDVNAVPGDGNLLGNLVCSLASLLDGTPDAIAEITDQLNQVLAGAGVAPAGTPTPAAEATMAPTTAPATEAPATAPSTAPTASASEATTAPAEPTTTATDAAPAIGTPVG